jgi:DNA-binding CsgD family transcriptional regulator/tetratricopeptide (TPR) repeat protein
MIGRVVRRVSSSIFVGRVAERARLAAALDAASSGEPGVILLGGEAGIGKTRLVGELISSARSSGALALTGRCLELTTGALPFAPIVELVRDLQRRLSDADLEAVLDADRSTLALLDPHLGAASATDLTPTSSPQFRLYRAFADVLARASAARAIVMLVEDVHWADASTLDLLRYLTRGLIAERLLVILTFRSDELHRRHPLMPFLSQLGRLHHVERLEMPRFGPREIEEQLSGILAGSPSGDLVDRISSRSDGNPFFVEELVAASPGGQLAGSLRDVLAARLGALSAEARAVVGVAAVIGRRADDALLADVAGSSRTSIMDALREATEHHILVAGEDGPTSDLMFRHALVREFAYSELIPPERIALHAAIAAALADRDAPASEIAHHAYLAHDLPVALVRSIEAAERATKAFAFAEALAHLERALEVWDRVAEPEAVTGRDMAGLLIDAARCAGGIGEYGRARDLGRTALGRLTPTERRQERVEALLDQYWYEMFAGDHAAQRNVAYETAALVPEDAPTALRATVLTNLSQEAEVDGHVLEARALAEEALAVARSVGARREEAAALVRLAKVVGESFGQPETAETMVLRALEIASEHGGFPGTTPDAVPVFIRAAAANLAGRFEDAILVADTGIDAATRIGRMAGGGLWVQKAAALIELGRWIEAEAMLREIRQSSMVLAARQADDTLALLLILQGRLEEAADVMSAGPGEPGIDRQWTLFAQARLAAAERRWDEARAAVDAAVGLVPDPVHEVGLLFAMEEAIRDEADRVVAARRRRQPAEEEDARRVGLARLETMRRIATPAIELGGGGRLIEAMWTMAEAEGGRLEKRSDPAQWKAAADLREALRQPWATAYGLFRHAEAALAMRGLRGAAAESLRRAHAIATSLGAVPVVAEIEGLARRGRVELGAAVPEVRPGTSRATTEGGVVVVLTSREREVLSLVAAGHTNREIGERLFISEKTASVHVTNAMDKLGALSRYDAAGIASRLGLLGDAMGTPAGHGERPAN